VRPAANPGSHGVVWWRPSGGDKGCDRRAGHHPSLPLGLCGDAHRSGCRPGGGRRACPGGRVVGQQGGQHGAGCSWPRLSSHQPRANAHPLPPPARPPIQPSPPPQAVCRAPWWRGVWWVWWEAQAPQASQDAVGVLAIERSSDGMGVRIHRCHRPRGPQGRRAATTDGDIEARPPWCGLWPSAAAEPQRAAAIRQPI
jgi:hypothetical protein